METCELEFKRQDGAFFYAGLHSIGVELNGQRVIRSVVTDITERKRVEQALVDLNATLEHRVAEQTAEIRQTLQAVSEERQRLYDVLETLPVMVCLLTPDYHVAFANRAFRERYGEALECYEQALKCQDKTHVAEAAAA